MMLEARSLFSGYDGIDIVKDINFSAKKGEITALVGPNGCGKTTLLKSLARLLPYRGSVCIEGSDISTLSRRDFARKLALLSQNSGVYFPYSVYDTASLGRYPYSKGFLKALSEEDREIIQKTLVKLELWDEKDRLISELSGGQLQRVFLARTLVQDPEVILLDEPTNHLDLRHQVELLEYLSVWARENGRAVIAVLHDLNLARRFADSAVLMCRGLLVCRGTAESVLSSEALKEVYSLDIRAFMLKSLEKWAK